MTRMSNEIGKKSGWRQHGACRHAVRRLGVAAVVVLMVGCTPVLYSVDMKYVPTGAVPGAEGAGSSLTVTVAAFADLRKSDDPIRIGYVIKSNGEKIPVLPKFVRPTEAVAARPSRSMRPPPRWNPPLI